MASRLDLSGAIGQATDPQGLMQRVVDRTLELITGSTGVMVGLSDDRGVTYVCGAGHRVSALGTRVTLDGSLSGLAVRTGQVQRSDDTERDPRVDIDACRRLSVASLVCIPLTWMSNTIGVLAVNASKPNAFTNADVATLAQLAEFVSVAIWSAFDIARVSAQLLEVADPHGAPSEGGVPRPGDPPSDATSRYVMSILSAAEGDRLDSGRRIQAVLDDPSGLSMAFQPIIHLRTGEITALEALARFDITPYRTPDRWFQEAHSCSLGIDLELLAIRTALASLGELPEGVALTVNAGPQVVMSAGFGELFPAGLAERVILELTEHTAVDDYAALITSLRALRRLGLRVAIDDTGSGYSSLAHILKLAPDFIKLDRELTSGIDFDPVRRALAASLVAFAADTGAHIIAEGVETPDELGVLEGLGIGYAQGFHLGHPSPLAMALAAPDPRPPARPQSQSRLRNET